MLGNDVVPPLEQVFTSACNILLLKCRTDATRKLHHVIRYWPDHLKYDSCADICTQTEMRESWTAAAVSPPQFYTSPMRGVTSLVWHVAGKAMP